MNKKIENKINEIFRRIGDRIQFDIMDLSKILNAGRQAALKGTCIETAMQEAVNKYGVKP